VLASFFIVSFLKTKNEKKKKKKKKKPKKELKIISSFLSLPKQHVLSKKNENDFPAKNLFFFVFLFRFDVYEKLSSILLCVRQRH
jgi:hypothetical protein